MTMQHTAIDSLRPGRYGVPMRALMALLLMLFLAGCSLNSPEGTVLPMVEDCDLHRQACTLTDGDRRITLDITPKPIPVAKPLTVTVTLHGLKAKKVQLDISGINMYMGYNRLDLHPVSETTWQGRAILAFCTNEKMIWRVTVLITTPDGALIQAPFRLITRRDRPYLEPAE